MYTRSTLYTLQNIVHEIAKSDTASEPANLALGIHLNKAIRCFDVSGTVSGYYGSGKSLLSILYSLLKTGSGEPTIVLEVNTVLRLEGKKNIGAISPTVRILDILKDDNTIGMLSRWLSKVSGKELSSEILLPELKKLKNTNVEIEGKGTEKLLNVSNSLKNLGISKVILDNFERILARPDAYGYRNHGEFLEDLFILADRKDSRISLVIPYRLWLSIDFETLFRLQPVTNIVYESKDLEKFFENLVKIYANGDVAERIIQEFSDISINFKVPRAVVNVAYEAIKRGSLNEAVINRLIALYIIANSYPTMSVEKRVCLFLLYCYAWFQQNINEPVEQEKFESILIFLENLCNSLCETGLELPRKFRKFLSKCVRELTNVKYLLRAINKMKFIECVGDIYIISASVVEHILNKIFDARFMHIVSRYTDTLFEPKSLLVEMQLQA